MLRNHIKIAFRNLSRNKFISLINIVGLSAGMAVFILIALWIWDEVSFDTYHTNYDKIAKVRLNIVANHELQTSKTVPMPLADELQSNYKRDFRYVIRSSHRLSHILAFGNKKMIRTGVFMSGEAPLMLSLRMLKGSSLGLNEPHSILLSESTAKTVFGFNDPLGKIIRLDNKEDVKVTGVFQDLPGNTTFSNVAFISPFELYVNSNTWIKEMSGTWNENPIQLYVQLGKEAKIGEVSNRIKNIIKSKVSDDVANSQSTVLLEPMRKWHLYTYEGGKNETGSIKYVKMFALIGCFVLLLACFNFMNLSTAHSEKRAREVGVRKAIGSLKSQLVKQFFCESILISLFAFACSLVLVQLSIGFFNELTGKDMKLLWSSPYLWISGVCLAIFTGLVAGSYPAFYLSSFNPVKVLKGTFKVGRNASVPRKALVVVQFTISIVLTICTVVVFRQIQHAKDREAGYNPENLLLIPLLTDDIPTHFNAVKTELLNTRVIMDMARSESTTTDIWGTDDDLYWTGKDPKITIDFPNTGVSANYGKTVGWTFTAGRDFSSEFPSDSSAFVLNEAAVKFMGLKNPVGEIIRWKDSPFKVIGVIRDMIVESPYDPVRPSIYCLAREHDNFAIVRLSSFSDTREALATIERVFKKFSPLSPFKYEFIDERYAKKFDSEEQVVKLAGFFTGLAIFISCLGIFAMASFMSEQRSKEISVRKVFGASAFSIWRLLSREFTELVFISLLISTPIAYYLMYSWLQHYEYRTSISWWIFIMTAISVIAVTLVTVCFQTIRAALKSPGKSLRNE